MPAGGGMGGGETLKLSSQLLSFLPFPRHGRYGRHGRHDVKPGPRSTLLQYLHCRAFTTEPPWAFNVCLQLAYCKHDVLALIYRFKPQMKCLLSIISYLQITESLEHFSTKLCCIQPEQNQNVVKTK